MKVINYLLQGVPNGKFGLILEAILEGNRHRTVGHSFVINSKTTLDQVTEFLTPYIENFESQSGTGEDGPSTFASRLLVRNITSAPNPEAIPFTSDSSNVQWKKDTKANTKANRRASPSLAAINTMNSKLDSLNTGFERLSSILQSQAQVPHSSPSQPNTPLGINWTPIVQGLLSGVAQSFGGSVNFPPAGQTPEPVVQPTPSSQPGIDLKPVLNRLDYLESQLSKLDKLESSISQLNQAQANLTTSLDTLAKGLIQTNQALTSLLNEKKSSGSDGNSSNGNGTSTPPTKNSPSLPKAILREISALMPFDKPINFENRIVTADLEALINPQGFNLVYMAAWYNGIQHRILDISQFNFDTNRMLGFFWEDLIKVNKGKICYFHNWAGYDAILSLPALLSLPKNYTFKPIFNNGEMMSITIMQGTTTVLTIKDSIRILPGALGKLAKDWGVETQKDHFPHYFFLNDIKSTLQYIGTIPPYTSFEPKRTSELDYAEMVKEFSNKQWSFLEVSKQYILGDVKALFQVMVAFFETLKSKFPIDPLTVLSAPSTAFKIWRTVQLPILNKDLLKVYDLSKTLDSTLRKAYCGGIVDVYRPHLQGVGYYYDVNSLYPTAMTKTMPVGMPTLINLTVSSFLEDDSFFGFVEATVQAPAYEYIGLLPVKLQGKLICPGGIFTGFFFSEELRFALKHGYQLISIGIAYSFQRGVNTFLNLIQQLNQMKIDAQMNKQPTIRNIAKLLMNSMYGRFGMHTDLVKQSFLDQAQILKLMAHYTIISQMDFGALSLVAYTFDEALSLGEKHNSKVFKKYMEGVPGNTNVAIAAAVTAYSRMIINTYKLEALKMGLDIYYSDTDSLVLNGQLPEQMIDSATLGKLKLEHKFKEI
jgi:TolA-binding protein